MKKSSNGRNSERKNGKAWKKRPKTNRSRGKTIGGYSLKKLAIRQAKRKSHKGNPYVVNVVNGDLVGDNVKSVTISEG